MIRKCRISGEQTTHNSDRLATGSSVVHGEVAGEE